MEAVECGAAALGMVLAYHGCHVPLADLREECGVSRDGSKASMLLQAARRRGLIARGLKAELHQLPTIPLPAILYWNFNHFVVLEGCDTAGQKFWINDPESGPRHVSAAEFDACFTGVILSFEPGAGFQPQARKNHLKQRIRKNLTEQPVLSLFVILCSLLLIVPGIAIPGLLQVFVDDYYLGSEDRWLSGLILGAILLACLQIPITGLQRLVLHRWQAYETEQTSAHWLRRILHQPLGYFTNRSAVEIANRLSMSGETADQLATQIIPRFLRITSTLAFGIMLVLSDAFLAVIVFGFTILQGALLIRTRREDGLAHVKSRFEITAVSGLSLIETLKCGGIAEFLHRLNRRQNQIFATRQQSAIHHQWRDSTSNFIGALAFITVLSIGVMQITRGELTIGTWVAFQMWGWQFHASILSWMRWPEERETFHENMARLEDGTENQVLLPSTTHFQQLEAINLNFSYAPFSLPVIKGINVSLHPGQRIALVGASGCGKSTLLKLLAGWFLPTTGEVRLNGSAFSPESAATCMALLESDFEFFDGTISENLRLGNHNLSDEDLISALRVVGLPEAQSTHPDYLNTLLRANGSNLSGGQRQRLEIARVLLRNPELVLLDEATNALDPENESAIVAEFFRRGCTMIWATHRSELMKAADEIWVLDRGTLVERGSFDDLSHSGPVFQQLLCQ